MASVIPKHRTPPISPNKYFGFIWDVKHIDTSDEDDYRSNAGNFAYNMTNLTDVREYGFSCWV